MKFFDSHAHYWDKRFLSETEEGVKSLLNALFSTNVGGIVNVGTSIESSLWAIEQAKAYDCMYVAAGIHPSDCEKESLEESLSVLETLMQDKANKIKAIGEIGLDYHWTPFDKERQKLFFKEQMVLAEKLAMPVVIHDREAHGDCFDMIRSFPNVRGVFHSYSGSPEMAKELVRRDYMISFSGTISFKNAHQVKEVAKILPKDKVMIETDAPYLTPHPHRGKLNHSGYLPYTCEALAEVWNISVEAAAEITFQNALRFFQIN